MSEKTSKLLMWVCVFAAYGSSIFSSMGKFPALGTIGLALLASYFVYLYILLRRKKEIGDSSFKNSWLDTVAITLVICSVIGVLKSVAGMVFWIVMVLIAGGLLAKGTVYLMGQNHKTANA